MTVEKIMTNSDEDILAQEKGLSAHISHASSEDGDNERVFTAAETKKLLRKQDWHIVPFLACLYLLSFLDRTNIGNARLFNLEKDLGMANLDYNIALAAFFPAYVLAEIPSNLMMKRIAPYTWITIIMIAWAVCTICLGFVSNLNGLIAARVFLGLAEGGLFPGVTFYISLWYCRSEVGFRTALFFSAATAAGAFGGLLARGIGSITSGLKPWAWIFVIEGILTLVVAAIAYWAINDYPARAKFLTETERTEVLRRLKADRSGLADEFSLKYFRQAITDWRLYVNMLITMGVYTPLYSISLFLPTIIKTMGNGQYSPEQSQLLSVPPYVVGCFFTIGAGIASDRYKSRGPFMMFFCVVAAIGWIMLLSSGAAATQYIGCFFAVSGIYPMVPLGVSWTGNNLAGSVKRGTGIAMHVGWGNLGGVVASFMYLSKDSPRFQPGHATLIGFISMAFVLSTFMTIYWRRENARRDREYKAPALYTEAEREAEREKGDRATFFRYTV